MDKSKQLLKQTLVEEGTELKGTLKSTCQVVVNGAIDGQIEAPALTITGTGSVLGSVKAQKLRSEGTLAGDIDADDVYLAGTVGSNTMIRARKLEVKLAPERGKLAVTFGECIIDVGDDPAVVKEPLPELVKAAPVVAAPADEPAPLAAAPAAVDEPSWSEPPAAQRKNSERRDSQAPPA